MRDLLETGMTSNGSDLVGCALRLRERAGRGMSA